MVSADATEEDFPPEKAEFCPPVKKRVASHFDVQETRPILLHLRYQTVQTIALHELTLLLYGKNHQEEAIPVPESGLKIF